MFQFLLGMTTLQRGLGRHPKRSKGPRENR